MSKQVARVIVASEHPKMRYRLKELVEDEPGTVVIGQAENASRTLALARKLRPDFAVIDSYLPHVIGLDTIPLSRAGGLDTAQVISEEIPHVRVILLTNTEGGIPPGSSFGQDLALSFAKKELAASVPLKLREPDTAGTGSVEKDEPEWRRYFPGEPRYTGRAGTHRHHVSGYGGRFYRPGRGGGHVFRYLRQTDGLFSLSTPPEVETR